MSGTKPADVTARTKVIDPAFREYVVEAVPPLADPTTDHFTEYQNVPTPHA
jgi:hypothetical protein